MNETTRVRAGLKVDWHMGAWGPFNYFKLRSVHIVILVVSFCLQIGKSRQIINHTTIQQMHKFTHLYYILSIFLPLNVLLVVVGTLNFQTS